MVKVVRLGLWLVLVLGAPSALGRAPARSPWALRRSARGKLSQLTPLSGGCLNQVFGAIAKDGTHVVLRAADPEENTAHHEVVRQIAEGLGAGTLVLPAAAVQLTPRQQGLAAGQRVMETYHFEPGFVTADKAPPEWYAHVSEQSKLKAAVVYLLSRQMDGQPKNIALNERGDLHLFDLDLTFGKSHDFIVRPTFFPAKRVGFVAPFVNGEGQDQALSYTSAQERVEDLPEDTQAYLRRVARLRLQDLQAAYGIDDAKARLLRDTARLIVKRGLTQAFEELWARPWRGSALGGYGMVLPAKGGATVADHLLGAPRGAPDGVLAEAPALRFDPGDWTLAFHLLSTEKQGDVARLEIVDERDRVLSQTNVGAAEFVDGKAAVAVPWRAEKGQGKVQARVVQLNGADLAFDRVELK